MDFHFQISIRRPADQITSSLRNGFEVNQINIIVPVSVRTQDLPDLCSGFDSVNGNLPTAFTRKKIRLSPDTKGE
jgi:hypothetical protein